MGRKDEKLNEYCQDCLLFDTHIYDDVDVMCSTIAAGYIVDLIYGYFNIKRLDYLKIIIK